MTHTPNKYQQLSPSTFHIPDWIEDQHINWHDGYSNRPSLHLLVPESLPLLGPLPIWQREGDAWVGRAPDGRIGIHYHGPLTTKLEDGRRCTAPSEGYGGRHFSITLTSGEEVVLRGPWHGGPIPFTSEVTIHHSCSRPYKQVKGEPDWFHCLGFFGTYIMTNIFQACIERAGFTSFLVETCTGRHIEPGYPDGPKEVSASISTKGCGYPTTWIEEKLQ